MSFYSRGGSSASSKERMQFSHQSGGLPYDPHRDSRYGPQQQHYYDRRSSSGDSRYGPLQQQHYDRRNSSGDSRYGPLQQQHYDRRNSSGDSRYGPLQQQHYDRRNHYESLQQQHYYGPPQQQHYYDRRNHYESLQQQFYDRCNPHHNGHGYSRGNYDGSHGPRKQSRPLSNRSNDRSEHSEQHRMQKYQRLSYQQQSAVMQVQPRFQPQFNTIRSKIELVQNAALNDFQHISRNNIAPFWNTMSKLAASGREQPQADHQIDTQTMHQHLRRLIQFTRDAVRSLRGIPLSLIAHAFAKIITTLQGNGGRDNCVMAAFRVLFLDEESHLELFDDLAKCIIQKKNYGDFNGAAISNTLWAYAKLGIVHQDLFHGFVEHIVGLRALKGFSGQHVSIILWAIAKSGIIHQDLFHGFAEHIIRLPNLTGFDSLALTNILWAFGTTKISHEQLFRKISDEVISDMMMSMSLEGGTSPQCDK